VLGKRSGEVRSARKVLLTGAVDTGAVNTIGITIHAMAVGFFVGGGTHVRLL
jgi:hypothetical protein